MNPDLAARCRCKHIRLVHRDNDGRCLECGCPEYRRDAHQAVTR